MLPSSALGTPSDHTPTLPGHLSFSSSKAVLPCCAYRFPCFAPCCDFLCCWHVHQKPQVQVGWGPQATTCPHEVHHPVVARTLLVWLLSACMHMSCASCECTVVPEYYTVVACTAVQQHLHALWPPLCGRFPRSLVGLTCGSYMPFHAQAVCMRSNKFIFPLVFELHMTCIHQSKWDILIVLSVSASMWLTV